MITMIKGLSKMGKVRFVVFAAMSTLILGLSVVALEQKMAISHLKASQSPKVVKVVKTPAVDKGTINIPEDGKWHTIDTNLFTIELVNYDGANFNATITPKIGRVVGQQGPGARGLDIMNVSQKDPGYTTIVTK
ncbi:hypothetical protein [Lactobacillus taiwanensis]|uniref:hypothetical protein n=1 Tax=Lactobacillus taiwanensis TaxID=508451 RepID=UPI00321FAC8B